MSVGGNKAVIRRHVELWNNKDTTTIHELHAPTYVEHGPGGEEGSLVHLKNVFQQHLDDYSEYHYTITKMVAEGDEVVILLDEQRTEAASGQRVANTGMHIYRLAGGKIQELWGVWSQDRPA
jgi:predicted SnoaL-like aldol condensation-catalyzing enzyme